MPAADNYGLGSAFATACQLRMPTAVSMETHLLHLLARDGPWMLFTAQALGVFGLPIPDELLLTAAGSLVRRGDLSLPATLAAAICGAAAGMTVSYMLGRLGGRVLKHVPVARDTVDRTQWLFKRWGQWLLVFGCFIPGVRHVIAIAAGSAALDFPRFSAYAYSGAALWSITFIGMGYYA
jgi:membrane protein DedA with SNARE-associated domain